MGINILLKNGADIEARNNDGNHPLLSLKDLRKFRYDELRQLVGQKPGKMKGPKALFLKSRESRKKRAPGSPKRQENK